MSKRAYSREQARRRLSGESERESSLSQHPFAAVDHAPPANTSESAPPLNTGHDFGQIAIQPAPTAAPQMKRESASRATPTSRRRIRWPRR